MDHVLTQLPYALICAGITIIGYLIVGFTGSVWYGLASLAVCLFIVFGFLSLKNKRAVN